MKGVFLLTGQRKNKSIYKQEVVFYNKMTLNTNQAKEIKDLLRQKIDEKLKNYARETSSMPFLAKLMQDNEKVVSHSFIQSLLTTLGMSIYEEVAKIIAEPNFDVAKTGYDVIGEISNDENNIISKILQEIKNKTRKTNKEQEVKEILQCKSKIGRKIKVRADLYLKRGNDEYYLEIKTAKPNIDVFAKSKEKLLQ